MISICPLALGHRTYIERIKTFRGRHEGLLNAVWMPNSRSVSNSSNSVFLL